MNKAREILCVRVSTLNPVFIVTVLYKVVQYIFKLCNPVFLVRVLVLAMPHPLCRVSDQSSDGLIFGRLFQANERFSAFRSCASL